jgi:hypothetical protein
MLEPDLDLHRQAYLAGKRAELATLNGANQPVTEESDFPPGAELCGKCHTRAAVVLDGCLTCLNCGESKCG